MVGCGCLSLRDECNDRWRARRGVVQWRNGSKRKKIRLPDDYRRRRQATTPAGPRTGNRSTVPAVCGLLLLAVIAVFGQTAGHDFVNFDDDDYVYENRHVRGGLTGEGIAWAFTDSHLSAHWHPLTWLSLMADAQVLRPGEGPLDRARLAAGMHLVNVALHAANAVLLFLVLRAMTASTWPSALVAAVFAVHPLHVESVAWITERKDVLSGLFGLLALGAYAWYARGPSVVRYLLVAAALALGLMAKPVLVTWPLVFLLLDYWPLGRFSQRRVGGAGKSSSDGALREPAQNTDERFQGSDSVRNPPVSQRFAPRTLQVLIVEKIPLLLLVAASAVVTFLAQRSGGDGHLPGIRANIRTDCPRGGAVRRLPRQDPLAGESGSLVSRRAGGEFWPALGAGVLLALLTAGALWGAWRGQRWLAVGWFWYLGTLLPTIGLVQVGSQVMADRFLYLPQIGLCVALVWGAATWPALAPYRRWPLAASAGAAGGRPYGLCLATDLVLAEQRDVVDPHVGLYLAEFDRPQQPRPRLGRRGQIDEAIAHYRKALEINPDYGWPTTTSESPWPAADRSTRPSPITARPWKSSPTSPGPLQPRHRLGRPRPGRRGHRPFPEGPGNQARLRRRPQQPRPRLGRAADRSTRPSPITGRPWKSSPTSCRPTESRSCPGRPWKVRRGHVQYQKALDLASARNDKGLADVIRARIRLLQNK